MKPQVWIFVISSIMLKASLSVLLSLASSAWLTVSWSAVALSCFASSAILLFFVPFQSRHEARTQPAPWLQILCGLKLFCFVSSWTWNLRASFPVSEEETLQRHKRKYLDLRAKLSTNDMTDVQGLQFFCLRLVLCAGWARTGSHLGGFWFSAELQRCSIWIQWSDVVLRKTQKNEDQIWIHAISFAKSQSF